MQEEIKFPKNKELCRENVHLQREIVFGLCPMCGYVTIFTENLVDGN